MQVKQLLLKLKAFGLDITALQNKDVELQGQIDSLRTQLENLDVTETVRAEIEAALTEFEKTVDAKDEAVKVALREEIAAEVSALNALIATKADALHTHDADDIIESEEKQFVSAAKKEQYDENTIFNTDMLTVNALGGIKAGEDLNNLPVQQLLTKLLYPYVAPTISASGTPNGGTYEKGNAQTVTNIRAVVTKKSEKITKVEVFDGSTSLGVKEGDEVANGGTFNFPVSVPVSANKNFQAKATDASGKVVSANTGSFSFVYPYYYGVVEADKATLTEDEIKAMTKKVEGKGNKSHAFTCNNQRMVIAYPKAYGVLKTIIDPNGFDNFTAFSRAEVSITGLDGTAQAYYVYVNGASTVTNFTMKFNY